MLYIGIIAADLVYYAYVYSIWYRFYYEMNSYFIIRWIVVLNNLKYNGCRLDVAKNVSQHPWCVSNFLLHSCPFSCFHNTTLFRYKSFELISVLLNQLIGILYRLSDLLLGCSGSFLIDVTLYYLITKYGKYRNWISLDTVLNTNCMLTSYITKLSC